MEEKIADKKVLSLVPMSNTFKMIIPADVERKIRFACKEVWSTEWSGTLFYTYEGNFEDGSLVITCKDFYIMDIGTQAYTEFDMNPDVIAYMTEHQELLDCQMGLIHSHNNMSTFFSGTDTATLKEEGKDRNNFVSLIVNNAGSYTAAVTRLIKSVKEIKDCYSYEFFGEGTSKQCKNYTKETVEIQYFHLSIIKEGNNDDFNEMKSRLDHIRSVKKDKAKKIIQPQSQYYFPNQNYVKTAPPKKYLDKSKPKKETKSYKEFVQKDLPFKEEDLSEPCDIPYGEVVFDKANLKVLLLQLITGSITLGPNSKLDINEWMKIMPKVYDRRFGEGKDGLKLFNVWAEMIVEFIVYYSEDEKLSELGLNDDEIAAVCAHDLVVELTKFPENRYTLAFIDALEKYIL